MSARFRRIIHQQAQVLSFETCYSKPESLTIVMLSNILNIYGIREYIYGIHGIISMVFTKLLLGNALGIRPCNCEAASEPLLPKVARCIPVLLSSNIGKCATRVLKRSDESIQFDRWQ